MHMNSVVVFSLGKSSFRFLKLYCARTSLSMAMPSPMSITQLSRGSNKNVSLVSSRRGRENWVMDIGEGMAMLKEVLAQCNFKNLN